MVLKLFTVPGAFEKEQQMYSSHRIAAAVGDKPVFMDNQDRSAATPAGFLFPPFAVYERQQPLAEWMQRFPADNITSMQVLCSHAFLVGAFVHGRVFQVACDLVACD